MRYDIDADQLASDMFQVRYADECFVLTATYTDNYYHNQDIVDGQTLMLRFELKHLGEFGYSTDVLERHVHQRAAVGRLTESAVSAALQAGVATGRLPRRPASRRKVRATGPPMFASINRQRPSGRARVHVGRAKARAQRA